MCKHKITWDSVCANVSLQDDISCDYYENSNIICLMSTDFYYKGFVCVWRARA